jgi:RNA polymerase sigma factor (sigma-70 family)
MRIKYEFVTGDEYVEIPDDWKDTFETLEKEEVSNYRKEHRRHVSLSAIESGEKDEFLVDLAAGQAFEDLETLELIRNMLDALTPEQRELAAALIIEDVTPAEISRRLGITKPSVHNRIERIKKRLKSFREGG